LRHPRNYRFSDFREAGYMARLPLMVLPGIPHHETQRGNKRACTFFEDADYALYLDLLAEAADRHGVEIWF
jgi:putative transposase